MVFFPWVGRKSKLKNYKWILAAAPGDDRKKIPSEGKRVGRRGGKKRKGTNQYPGSSSNWQQQVGIFFMGGAGEGGDTRKWQMRRQAI